MTMLKIFDEGSYDRPQLVTHHPEEITEQLQNVGVWFERWPTKTLDPAAEPDAILTAYADEVERLKQEQGFQTADVVKMRPDHPEKDAFRQKFLAEHRHSEDEVRFFVEGQGLFYLHLDGKVFVVLCEQNDLISVPAETPHWFDMGPAPHFTCIRLFTNPEGWVAQFTGDTIAEQVGYFNKMVPA